jgi:hypothetical protein
MMANFYVTATGEIDKQIQYEQGTSASTILLDQAAGHSYILGYNIDMNLHYISGGVKTNRPFLYGSTWAYVKNNGGADADGILQFALPAGTEVFCGELDIDVVSGAENFTFQTDIVGEWTFSFDPPFPYVPLILTVEANVD